MKMGVSTRERGVLKLVHPGRHVEIHKEPIAASEIMRKYPRHCIARPDVFKYPYIVVRPESVLVPGKVFYLVPNRTLYNLLKARAQHSQPSCQENQPPQYHDRQDSDIKCLGGKAPKNQVHDRGQRRRLRNMLGDRSNSYVRDSEDFYSSDTSYVDAWGELGEKVRKAHLGAHPADSSFDSSPSFCSKGYNYNGNNAISTVSIVRKGCKVTSALSDIVANEDVRNRISGGHGKLKSCIKKEDSVRKFLNLRVTFASPIINPRISGRSSSIEQTN